MVRQYGERGGVWAPADSAAREEACRWGRVKASDLAGVEGEASVREHGGTEVEGWALGCGTAAACQRLLRMRAWN